MKSQKKIDTNTIRLLVVMCVVFAVMSIARTSLFLSMANLQSMGTQAAELGLFSIAMMLSFVSGGIDMSIVGTANLTGITVGYMFIAIKNAGLDNLTWLFIILAFVIAVAIGTACGVFNSVLISRFRIHPLLATMGTMNLYMGLATILTKASTLVGFPIAVSEFANTYFGPFSAPLITLIIMAIIVYILLTRTRFGIELRFFGTNALASHYTGIDNPKVLMKTYVLSGIISAICGVVMVAKTNTARSEFGESYVFTSMLVTLLAGVNPTGGTGTIPCLVLAVATLQFLTSGFNMMGMDSSLKDFIYGALLLVVMVINYLSATGKLKKKS